MHSRTGIELRRSYQLIMSKGTVKLIIFAAVIAVIIGLNHHYGWSDMITGDNWYADLRMMVNENLAGAIIIYIVVMVVACVVLAVPGVTFAIVAGAIFGPWLGTVLCVLAATIGAILSFLVGRFFLQDSLRDKISSNKYISRILFDRETKNEMLVLAITRLVPVFPYNLQNFAYGITDISLVKYSIGTFLFMIPGTAMYTFGTYAIADGTNRWLYAGITAVLIAAVMLISRRLRNRYVTGETDDVNEN